MPLDLKGVKHHHTAGDIYTNNYARSGGALSLQVQASSSSSSLPSNLTFLSDGKNTFGNVDVLDNKLDKFHDCLLAKIS